MLAAALAAVAEPRASADDVEYRAVSVFVPAPPPEPRCPVSEADPDGDCDAGKAGEEDDNPIVCHTTHEPIEVCGRTETLTKTNCDQVAVTELMAKEAPLHPELRDEFVRINACVSASGTCTPEDDTTGGAVLNDQVASYPQGVVDRPARSDFHFSVTRDPLESQRTDLAQVFHKGYRRLSLSQHLMYRTRDHDRFHDDAEGVDLASQAMADRERAEQLKLAGVLKEMSDKFEAMGEDESADLTANYGVLARSRALELEAISCELGRMAALDRLRQENMKSAGDLRFASGSLSLAGSDTATSTDTASDVSGVGDAPPDFSVAVMDPFALLRNDPRGARGPAAATSVSTSTSTAAETSLLGSDLELRFGPDPAKIAEAAARAAARVPGDDESLFVRVHRKYRKLDALGRFPKSILDGPP